jgi:hypothetical protein
MVHFFGILKPGSGTPATTAEAPGKTNFFGGVSDFSFGAIPMSRAEQDMCFLTERCPEPAEDLRDAGPGFARFRSPTRL